MLSAPRFLPLKIESLTLNNIGPFKTFEEHFGKGVNLIYGPIGSGKTTILQSLLLAFGVEHQLNNQARIGGVITLNLFPAQTSIIISDNESTEDITKRYRCVLADDVFEHLTMEQKTQVLDEFNRLNLQTIATASPVLRRNDIPLDAYFFTLENYPFYRRP